MTRARTFNARRGPRGWRAKVENCLRIDVLEERLFCRGGGGHRIRLFGPLVDVERVPCHFGGARAYFLCPDCRRRCLYLYAARSRYSCRVCLDLIYRSEGEGAPWALRRRLRKLLAMLPPDQARPERMRVDTFLRIRRKLDAVQEQIDALLLKQFGKVMRPR